MYACDSHHVVEDLSSGPSYALPFLWVLQEVLQEVSEMITSVPLSPWCFNLVWDACDLSVPVYGTKVYFCGSQIT